MLQAVGASEALQVDNLVSWIDVAEDFHAPKRPRDLGPLRNLETLRMDLPVLGCSYAGCAPTPNNYSSLIARQTHGPGLESRL